MIIVNKGQIRTSGSNLELKEDLCCIIRLLKKKFVKSYGADEAEKELKEIFDLFNDELGRT